ncbi:MAG: N-acetylmuramoyl-L-alanine amidase [Ruminococcus sp.]
MKLVQDYAKTSACYMAGRSITPKGLMLHSVGCNQPDPFVFARIWKSSDDVCAHAVLGADGTVIQTLPWTWRGWHAGGNANNTHIGVEMCEPSTIRYSSGANWTDTNPDETKKYVLGTYKTAVELFAYLCNLYKLNPLGDGVIISHSEGYRLGVASGHADVEHIWNTLGLTMNQFRKDVKAAMGGSTQTEPTETETGNTASEPYRVRVTIDDLNIRTGPGTQYKTTGKFTGKGVFTIVETQGTWGRLKSGAGWISLNYAEKLTDMA